MPKPNLKFELTVSDLDLIEDALRSRKQSKVQAESSGDAQEARQIHELLGRLHNQKTFYRPAKTTYISG